MGDSWIASYTTPKNAAGQETVKPPNFLNLAGSYPKDRERLIADVDAAMAAARLRPGFDSVPAYAEEYY